LNERHLLVQRKVDDWIKVLMKENGLNSLKELFSCVHSGTIPSCILQCSQQIQVNGMEETEEEKIETIFRKVKSSLSNIILPLPGLLSLTLNLERPRYHLNLCDLLYDCFEKKMMKNDPLFVMTRTPFSPLDLQRIEKVVGMKVSGVCVSEIESERKLIQILQNHFHPSFNRDQINSQENGNFHDELLIIQFDLITSSLVQITHAIFLTSRFFSLRLNQSTKYRRPILYLLHSPPRIRDHSLLFALDFHVHWLYYYIDEIYPTEECQFLIELLTTPLHHLFLEKKCDLYEIVLKRLMNAVSNVQVQGGSNVNVLNRYQLLKKAISSSIQFKNLFLKIIWEILRHKTDVKSSGLYLHVCLAIREKNIGPIFVSVNKSIEEIVLQATTSAILYLEKNNNLSTLRFGCDEWLTFAQNPNLVDIDAICMLAKVGGRSVEEVLFSSVAVNTGKFGPLVSRFPFSYGISSMLNGTNTRTTIDIQFGKKGSSTSSIAQYTLYCDALNRVSETVFGTEIIEQWKGNHQIDYLYDFVSLNGFPVANLQFDNELMIFRCLFRLWFNRNITTPPEIHAAFWVSEKTIQNIISILSLLPNFSRDFVLRIIEKFCSTPFTTLLPNSLYLFLWFIYETVVTTLWGMITSTLFPNEVQKDRPQEVDIPIPWLYQTCKQISDFKEQIRKCITLGIQNGKRLNLIEIASLISTISIDMNNLFVDISRSLDENGCEEYEKNENLRYLYHKWRSISSFQILLEEILIQSHTTKTLDCFYQNFMNFFIEDQPLSTQFFDNFLIITLDLISLIGCCTVCGGNISIDSNSLLCFNCNEIEHKLINKKESKKEIVTSFAGVSPSSSSSIQRPNQKLIQIILCRFVREIVLPHLPWITGITFLPSQALLNHLGLIVNTRATGLHALLTAEGFQQWNEKMITFVKLSRTKSLISDCDSLLRLSVLWKKGKGKDYYESLLSFSLITSVQMCILTQLLQHQDQFSINYQVKLDAIDAQLLYLRSRLSFHFERFKGLLKSNPKSSRKLLLFKIAQEYNFKSLIRCERMSIPFLDGIACLQVMLFYYVEALYSEIPVEESIQREFHEFFNDVLTNNSNIIAYLLKTVKSESGVDGVVSFIKYLMKKVPEVTWTMFVDNHQLGRIDASPLLSLESPVHVHNKKGKKKVDTPAQMEQIFLKLFQKPNITSQLVNTLNQIDYDELVCHCLPSAFAASIQLGPQDAEDIVKKFKDIFDLVKFKSPMTKAIPLLSTFVAEVSLSLLKQTSQKIYRVFSSIFEDVEQLLLLIQLRIAFLIVRHPNSWITSLVFTPRRWTRLILPASPSTFKMNESVHWYFFFNIFINFFINFIIVEHEFIVFYYFLLLLFFFNVFFSFFELSFILFFNNFNLYQIIQFISFI
jgi:hypothetical protein